MSKLSQSPRVNSRSIFGEKKHLRFIWLEILAIVVNHVEPELSEIVRIAPKPWSFRQTANFAVEKAISYCRSYISNQFYECGVHETGVRGLKGARKDVEECSESVASMRWKWKYKRKNSIKAGGHVILCY